MTAIATGVFKTVAISRQSALGTIGGVGTGAYIRRVKSTLDLAKTTFKSAEILTSQQRRDFRHGVKSIQGTISAELSVGGHQKFIESICRQVTQAVVTTGALTTISCSAAVSTQFTLNRSAGNWQTDGFRTGDIVNVSGFTTTGAGLNNRWALVSNAGTANLVCQPLDGLTNAGMTKVAGDSVTVVTVGKKTWIASASQVKHYYTIEHYFSDIAQSEVFVDCVITDMNVKLPPTGMATVDFPVLGLGYQESGSQYFTSPVAASTGGIEASVNGVINVNGANVGLITGMDFSIKGNYSLPGGVIGANVDPDVIPGVVEVTGNITAMFADTSIVDLFLNEQFFQIIVVLTSGGTTAQPAFTCYNFSRCKAGGASKDDSEKAITLTFPFTAVEDTTGGANTDTTVSVQDSAFS